MLEKPADTEHPIHDSLRKRWSPRAFSERPVEREKLLSLLEAARWAASCFNEQPWSYIVATKEDPAEFERLLGCLVEGNALWARHAPVLMLSVAKLAFEGNGKPNRHAFHDVGAASASLTFQATSLGLFVHQMAGIHVEKAREVYGIPQGFDPVAGIALGYPGDPDTLPEPLKERELAKRTRKPIAMFVFTRGWGKTSPLVDAP